MPGASWSKLRLAGTARPVPSAAKAPLPACLRVLLPLRPPAPRPAGRLLLQRLRKSQSTTVLYGEPEHALEQLSLGDGPAGSFFPQMDGGPTQVRLAVQRRMVAQQVVQPVLPVPHSRRAPDETPAPPSSLPSTAPAAAAADCGGQPAAGVGLQGSQRALAAAGQRWGPGQRPHGGGQLPNQVDRLARWVLPCLT